MRHGKSLTPGSVYRQFTFRGPWNTIDCPFTGWQRVTDPAAAETVPAVLELIFLVPFLAAGARRLHDIGRSGWWLLLILTVAGIVLLVVWWALASERGSNAHGAPPARSNV